MLSPLQKLNKQMSQLLKPKRFNHPSLLPSIKRLQALKRIPKKAILKNLKKKLLHLLQVPKKQILLLRQTPKEKVLPLMIKRISKAV